MTHGFEDHDEYYSSEADEVLSFDDIFHDEAEIFLGRYQLLADIGSSAEGLITRLKSERAPDYAKNTFVFDEEQLIKCFPFVPRIVDALLKSQYSLKELSVSFHRDYKKDTHALEVTFGLGDKHNPNAELHTLTAVRDDLRSPRESHADTFTYPPDATHPREESIRFPTLSASDLRKLVASLMPSADQSVYELYDDWVQAPENFEDIVHSFSMQDCTQIIDSTYKLYSPVGETVGDFTFSTFDGDLISAGLDLEEENVIAKYDIALGQLPPPADIEGMKEFDDFFSVKPTREVLNNDESPVMGRRFFPDRNVHSIPQAAGIDELIRINEALQNDPNLYKQPEDKLYGSTTDLTDTMPGEGIL